MKRLPLLFAAFGVGRALAGEYPANVSELFVTPENLRVVRGADRVDACLLRHIDAVTLPDGRIDWKTERYEETAFTPVPAAAAENLRALVLDGKSYDWKAAGGRRAQWYLRLRFHRGGEVVALDFCFLCRVLVVHHQGAELGRANFSPNNDLFLQAFLQVFPDDGPLRRVAREAGLPR